MRVISGKYRGRRLKGPRGMDLRPTGDRLKETLFNILKPRISGAVVLDVFSGTGSVGIEALSRGAGRVVFVERDPAAKSLIQQNLQKKTDENKAKVLANAIHEYTSSEQR